MNLNENVSKQLLWVYNFFTEKSCIITYSMNIWLDDQRSAPDGWLHLHNYDETKQFIESVNSIRIFSIETMSFDFHLSSSNKGIDVLRYLSDICIKNKTRRFWPKQTLFHSNDKNGIDTMKLFATQFEKEILPKL